MNVVSNYSLENLQHLTIASLDAFWGTLALLSSLIIAYLPLGLQRQIITPSTQHTTELTHHERGLLDMFRLPIQAIILQLARADPTPRLLQQTLQLCELQL